jgi:proteasome accessory factor A
VAIAKLLGIETEYGITSGGPEADPILTSTLLVNAYASNLAHHIRWDFNDESPGRDARGAPTPGSMAPMVEMHLANAVLTNGARFYVDHAHPEYSSPECTTPLEAVLYDRAGEEVLRQAMKAAAEKYPESPEIVVYKNNSDTKGNSYGTHENYLLDRAIPFAEIVQAVIPHLVSRQIFCGAGKIGFETPWADTGPAYQLSQRSEFFEEIVGLETTLKRPLVNTRDEPHSDPQRYRRLHIILGDANMAEVSTYLKLGTTALLLAMLEDGVLNMAKLELANPVDAVRQISADPTLTTSVERSDGSSISALSIQEELCAAVSAYVGQEGGSAVGGPGIAQDIVTRWQSTLESLRRNPLELAGQVDWIAKKRLLDAYGERHGVSYRDSRLRAMDLQYHDLRPERSLAQRLGLETLVAEADVLRAVTTPPRGTRAWFRGSCLAKFPQQVVTANWDSLVFDVGRDPLRRIPMMDPLRGTAEHTEALLDEVESVQELVARLDA